MRYVGQTVQKVKNRHIQHRNKGCGRNVYIDNYIRIHPYTIKLLYTGPESELDYMEEFYISELNTLWPNGLNLTTGGNSRKHQSEESKRRMSEGRLRYSLEHPNIYKAFRELMCDPQYMPKLHRTTYGKGFTEEHKQRISDALKGKPKFKVNQNPSKPKPVTKHRNPKNVNRYKPKPMTPEEREAWAQRNNEQLKRMSENNKVKVD